MHRKGVTATHLPQVLPMASVIAWFWFFPLFGTAQEVFFFADEQIIRLNLFFLSGMVSGHLLAGWFKPGKIGQAMMMRSPLILLVGMVLNLMSFSRTSLRDSAGWFESAFFMMLLPLFMGIAAGIYFVCWAAGIPAIPKGEQGRYMGLMLLLAAVIHKVLLLLHQYSIRLALLMVILLLLIPVSSPRVLTAAGSSKESRRNVPLRF